MTTKARFGNQHPTQSVILPYNESLCQKAIDYYEKTGRKCYDWQLDLLKPIMALDADGLWVHQSLDFLYHVGTVKPKLFIWLNFGRWKKD